MYSSQHHAVSPNEASQQCCTVEHKTNLLPRLIRKAGPESPVRGTQAVHKIRHLKDHLCQKAVLCIRSTAVARDTRHNTHTTGAILHQHCGTLYSIHLADSAVTLCGARAAAVLRNDSCYHVISVPRHQWSVSANSLRNPFERTDH